MQEILVSYGTRFAGCWIRSCKFWIKLRMHWTSVEWIGRIYMAHASNPLFEVLTTRMTPLNNKSAQDAQCEDVTFHDRNLVFLRWIFKKLIRVLICLHFHQHSACKSKFIWNLFMLSDYMLTGSVICVLITWALLVHGMFISQLARLTTLKLKKLTN